jgi:hypothetical protein
MTTRSAQDGLENELIADFRAGRVNQLEFVKFAVALGIAGLVIASVIGLGSLNFQMNSESAIVLREVAPTSLGTAR